MTTATTTIQPSTSHPEAAASTKFRKDRRINWWLTAVVAVFSLTILVPLYFTVVTALKTPAEAGSFSLPSSWQWGNFAAASAKVDYPRAALNSAIITVIAVSLTLVTNTFVAYAIARNMDKRFFRFLYYFFIAAMFVPFPVVMLPLAKQMGSWHLDNQAGLIILYVILGLGTNLFIATGFIRSIPVSLEEAARIDGAGTWRIFWRIIFPLMGPINATIAIMTALWAWNDFLLPLIILTNQHDQTIPLAQYVFSSQFATNYPQAFASYLIHGPGARRLHLRPEVGRGRCDAWRREVARWRWRPDLPPPYVVGRTQSPSAANHCTLWRRGAVCLRTSALWRAARGCACSAGQGWLLCRQP